MLVGAARQLINPEKGHNLFGYGPDYFCSGIHDDLSVTAAYFNDGTSEAFFLNYDLGGLVAASIKRIREAVSKATGVAAKNVFLAITHVHSAPVAIEEHPFNPGELEARCPAAYFAKLLDASAAAARQAKANAEECILRYNFAFVAENMNRRYNFPDRRSLYIPDHKQLVGTSSEYVDRELGIIAFRIKGSPNRYKAIITNYTCHPLCVGNSSTLVSADFHGVMRRHVEETFAGCLVLSTTGAAGDNHPLFPEGGFVAAESMGASLAKQAITRTYDSIPADFEMNLRMAVPEFSLEFKDELTSGMLPEKESRAQDLPYKGRHHHTTAPLLGIGPILLAGLPGEMMAEHGAMLKWSSPFLKTYALFIASDLIGYLPTVNQFLWGGYEANTSYFVRGSGEKVVREILAAADKLVAEKPLNLPAIERAGITGKHT